VAKVFDLLQACLCCVPSIVLFPQTLGLGRAQIPGADEWPLQAIEPTAVGCGVAAAFTASAQQLAVGHRDGGQVEKEQIFEIDPDRGVLAAYFRAGRACGMA